MAYYLIGQVGQPKFLHIETRIIKPKFSNVIFDTISNKCYTGRTNFIMNPPYKFKLIYRGSRDGISDSSFRDRCMLGKVASFVIIKIQESSKIYVVYRSCGFNSRNYLINFYDCNNDNDFILSFKNSENIEGDYMNMRHRKMSEDIEYKKMNHREMSHRSENTKHNKKMSHRKMGHRDEFKKMNRGKMNHLVSSRECVKSNRECDSLCMINEKLHVKHCNGNRWSSRNEKNWTTTNTYTIEEIEAFVKFVNVNPSKSGR
jgi:hypothetical protein